MYPAQGRLVTKYISTLSHMPRLQIDMENHGEFVRRPEAECIA